MSLYAYSEANSVLHKNLKLEKHFEGGENEEETVLAVRRSSSTLSLPSAFAESSFLPLAAGYFVQTEILKDEVPSPYAGKRAASGARKEGNLLLTSLVD